MKEIFVIYFEWGQPFSPRPLVNGPGSHWSPPATSMDLRYYTDSYALLTKPQSTLNRNHSNDWGGRIN